MKIACHDCDATANNPKDWHVYLKKDADGNEQTLGYKCPSCHEKNPKFQRKCEVFSRVTGYLRPVAQWNKGKRAEFKARKTYKVT